MAVLYAAAVTRINYCRSCWIFNLSLLLRRKNPLLGINRLLGSYRYLEFKKGFGLLIRVWFWIETDVGFGFF